jgi:PKD repeat protein
MPLAYTTNFSANITNGPAPLSVAFTDLSSPTPTSWLWDFGDGTTSTLQNPTHNYTVAGVYSVTLTPNAPHPSFTQTNYITVTVAGTEYTLLATDCGKETRVSNSTPYTNVHIPTDIEQPDILVGMTFRIKSNSSSVVTIVKNDGITLRTSSSLTIPQYTVAHLIKVGANEWDMDPIVEVGASSPIKPAPMTVSTTSATSMNFGSAAHHNTNFRMTSSSAISVIVQPDSFWGGADSYYTNNFNPTDPGPMPNGGSAIFGQHGTGVVSFSAGTGVTINTPATLNINKLNGKITLIKVSPNVWDIEGNLN